MSQQKGTNLWSTVLDETHSQVQRKFASTKSLLVIGDSSVGKSTLIAHLQGRQLPKKGAGLEYAILEFRDEYHDELRRLSVWIFANEIPNVSLLGYALNASNFKDTMVMLVLSMSEPWKWPQQMNYWLKLLYEHIEGLGLSSEAKEAAQQLLLKKWQYYLEEHSFGILEKRRSLKQFLQCKETKIGDTGIENENIEVNLGLDIVVVVTKVDQMAMLEKEFDMSDIHFSFMQQWLRHYCLKIGAGLIYTSTRNKTNCNVLQKYLAERIYYQSNDCKPHVLERDLLFVPAGWDSLGKITILNEQLTMLDSNCTYEALITEPPTENAKIIKEPLGEHVDEQAFLAKQLELHSDLLHTPSFKLGNYTAKAKTKCEDTIKNNTPSASARPLEEFFKDLLKKNTCARTNNNGVGDVVNVTAKKSTSSNIEDILTKFAKKTSNDDNKESKEQQKE